MGVIDGKRVPISAASSDDGIIREIISDFPFRVEDGVTTDDAASASEVEQDLEPGRIRLFLPRSHVRRQNNTRSRRPAVPVNLTPQPKVSQRGSKKFRRYENQLELLKECDEDAELQEISIEDLRGESTARAFSRIVNDSAMLELWNIYNDHEAPVANAQSTTKKPLDNNKEFDADLAFQRICRKLRIFLKQRHFPLGVMEALEEDLIEFFCNRPQDTFELSMNAFKRSILHALSQYNGLRSHSVKTSDKTDKTVRVLPPDQTFSPPPVRLTVYLESKRKPQQVFN